jgi:hypothetical protein
MLRAIALCGVAVLIVAAGCNAPTPEPPEDPPEVALGERLFLETRFAQFFAARAAGVNDPLATGDPVMDILETTGVPRPGPFAGKSMNCRQCHLVDESPEPATTGLRSYADFARRSPIPDRGDGRNRTPRNSPGLVNANLKRGVPLFLHFDGQFASAADLVEGTLTGRNFGWLPDEEAAARAHIARVMREDDGSDPLARPCRGLSYATLLRGIAAEIPTACRLPEEYRIDATAATDGDLLHAVAGLVSAYMETLTFARDAGDGYIGSPYDRFLILNGLPRQPEPGEGGIAYARRLRVALDALPAPKLVDNPGVLMFAHHDQDFVFGPAALAGLRIFLSEPAEATASAFEVARGGIGNCVACHAPPDFTDFGFHNNGVAQAEYDGVHGLGAFAALAIPTAAQRQADPESYLPASARYPAGTGTFLEPPARDRPGHVDLGLWNVFANDAHPNPQATLEDAVRGFDGIPAGVGPQDLLSRTVAVFKTATVRDLGQSAPYFHNAIADTLEDAVRHYLAASGAARAGNLRNGAAALAGVALREGDVADLASFLRALNEDYE